MSDELFEVLSRLFDPSCEQYCLLDPVGCLKEVIDFEAESHLTVGVVDPKVFGIKDWTVSFPEQFQTDGSCQGTYTRLGDHALQSNGQRGFTSLR